MHLCDSTRSDSQPAPHVFDMSMKKKINFFWHQLLKLMDCTVDLCILVAHSREQPFWKAAPAWWLCHCTDCLLSRCLWSWTCDSGHLQFWVSNFFYLWHMSCWSKLRLKWPARPWPTKISDNRYRYSPRAKAKSRLALVRRRIYILGANSAAAARRGREQYNSNSRSR